MSRLFWFVMATVMALLASLLVVGAASAQELVDASFCRRIQAEQCVGVIASGTSVRMDELATTKAEKYRSRDEFQHVLILQRGPVRFNRFWVPGGRPQHLAQKHELGNRIGALGDQCPRRARDHLPTIHRIPTSGTKSEAWPQDSFLANDPPDLAEEQPPLDRPEGAAVAALRLIVAAQDTAAFHDLRDPLHDGFVRGGMARHNHVPHSRSPQQEAQLVDEDVVPLPNLGRHAVPRHAIDGQGKQGPWTRIRGPARPLHGRLDMPT